MPRKTNKLEKVSIRLVKEAPIYSETKINEPKAAIRLLGDVICDLDRETICVINLKADGTPINCNFASIGSLSMTIASPRELLKTSILSNASGVIIMHNHPSNNLQPSKEDTVLTDRMAKIYRMMEINFLDHIIVGTDPSRFFSFREKEILTLTDDTKYLTNYQQLLFSDNVNKQVMCDSDRKYFLDLIQRLVEAKYPGATLETYEAHFHKMEQTAEKIGYLQTIGKMKDELYLLEKKREFEKEPIIAHEQ